MDQKSDLWPHWMAAHARLKNESTEDVKCHNLMSWLNFGVIWPSLEKLGGGAFIRGNVY